MSFNSEKVKSAITILEDTDDNSSHEELNEAINKALKELYQV